VDLLRRLEQQVDLVRGLSRELEGESSYRGVERLVQLTIQALLDLGLMVLSALGSSPTGYRDVANHLSRLNLLKPEDAELIRSMAGLRKVLVHAYAEANREIVIESSRRLPKDAVRLAEEILSSAKRVVKDPSEPLEDLADKLRGILKGRVRLAFIFGSQVKGYTLRGDLDIALYFGGHPDPYEVGRILFDIQEALGREDIDILVIDGCDDIALVHEALKGRPVLGSEAEVLWLKTKIASQYMDYQEGLGKIEAWLAGSKSERSAGRAPQKD